MLTAFYEQQVPKRVTEKHLQLGYHCADANRIDQDIGPVTGTATA